MAIASPRSSPAPRATGRRHRHPAGRFAACTAYYEELALTIASAVSTPIAFDWFGRPRVRSREEGFDYIPHVNASTWAGHSADLAGATPPPLRRRAPTDIFTVGFCFGGRTSFLAATLVYTSPASSAFMAHRRAWPGRIAEPVAVADRIARGARLFGAQTRHPPEAIAAFEAALSQLGVDHRLVIYPGAPHSFFDRKATDYAEASEQAWAEVLAFIDGHRSTERRPRRLRQRSALDQVPAGEQQDEEDDHEQHPARSANLGRVDDPSEATTR